MVKHMLQYVAGSDRGLDHVLHALADGSRRWMIEQLCAGPATVSDLAEPLPMSLSAVVQHIKVLEAADLVTTRKSGRVRTCELRAGALRPVDRWIEERKQSWGGAFDRLAELLADESASAASASTTSSTEETS